MFLGIPAHLSLAQNRIDAKNSSVDHYNLGCHLTMGMKKYSYPLNTPPIDLHAMNPLQKFTFSGFPSC